MPTCAVCDRPIRCTAGKQGRPARFCRPAEGLKRSACKDFANRLEPLSAAVESIPFTEAGARKIRRALRDIAERVAPDYAETVEEEAARLTGCEV